MLGLYTIEEAGGEGVFWALDGVHAHPVLLGQVLRQIAVAQHDKVPGIRAHFDGQIGVQRFAKLQVEGN